MARVPGKLWIAVSMAAVLVAGVTGGFVLSASGHTVARGFEAVSARKPVSISVVAVAPANGSTGVGGTPLVAVRFSGPVNTSHGFPTFSPPLPGVWAQTSPDELLFRPDAPLAPYTTETLTVAGADGAGQHGVRGASGGELSDAYSAQWEVGGGSTLRLQQILASLGYLPLTFTPTTPVGTDVASEDAAAYTPPAGSFSWRWSDTPAALQALWQPGVYGTMTRGAVMAFEADTGQATDGVAGPQVWAALLRAAATGTPAASGYSFVQVSETVPEHLVLWRNGAVDLTTAVNTGVHGAGTPTGVWPVYARYVSTTMTGTNPNGTHYNDHGVPFVNYFNGGDAVHGFTRAQYGFPQSDGCVELPLGAAQTAFGLLHVGDLVDITS